MGLHLWYGASTAKTTEQLYDRIIRAASERPDRRFVFLVPEQASLSVQEELVRRHPRHGLMNVDVLTFNRLGYRVFQETGETGKTVLDDTGKLMILRLVLTRMENELGYLKRNVRKAGFLDELKSVISELAEYNVKPETLSAQAEKMGEHPLLQAKLRDVAKIYGAFMEVLHRDYEMAEERMTRLAACFPKWDAARDTVFVLDGFTGLTPPQYEVLEAMLAACPEVYVSVTVGSGEDIEKNKAPEDLFHMGAVLAAAAKERAIRHSLSISERTVTDAEERAPEIGYIEKHLFRPGRAGYAAPAENVRIVTAKDPAEEVRLLTAEILKRIREGCRWRELAVICEDPDTYREEMEACFDDAGIPYFFDAKKTTDCDPLLLLVLSLLSLSEQDLAFDDAFSYAKNPLIAGNLADLPAVCELENYCLALSIRGRSMYGRPFEAVYKGFREDRLPAVNETREKVFGPVLGLLEKLRTEGTVREKTGALREFLSEIGSEAGMKALSAALSPEDGVTRQEYEKVWELLSGFLDEAERILGDRTLTSEEFGDVFRAGIGRLAVGIAPPAKDRLTVGDVTRTRLSGIRHLLIVGANEGVLPSDGAASGLLSDLDREVLEQYDLELAPTGARRSFFTQFYLYLLLTKPSESLYVSFSEASPDGKAMLPGIVVTGLRALFPEHIEEKSEKVLTTPREGLLSMADYLRTLREGEDAGPDIEDRARALYDWYEREPWGRAAVENVRNGFEFAYREEALSPENAGALFQETLSGSVTRLEQFAGCAFAHFLNYGLGLKEREEYRLEATDFGTLFHVSIDCFFRKLKENGETWQDVDLKRRTELVKEAVAEVTESYGNAILKDSARNERVISRILRITDRTLWALKEQWDAGTFTETETEVPFDGKNGPEALRLDLGDGLVLSLRGQIDRLDYVPAEDRVYVRVIDYKSGNNRLDLTKIYYGLQLQLLLYLEAASGILARRSPGREIVPAGVYYYHIEDPMIETEEQDPEEQILKELRLKGFTNEEPDALQRTDTFTAGDSLVVNGLRRTRNGLGKSAGLMKGETLKKLGGFTLDRAGELAKDLIRGRITVDPYEYGKQTACTFCPYKGVCGFDLSIDGYKRRKLIKKSIADLTGEEA